MPIEDKKKDAVSAINALFAFTGCAKSETLEALEEIASSLDMMIDALQTEIEGE